MGVDGCAVNGHHLHPPRVTNAVLAIRNATWKQRREFAVSLLLATACEAMIRWRRLPDLAKTYGLRLSPASDELEPVEAIVLPEWAVERLRITRRVMRNWPVDGACLRHALVAGHHPIPRLLGAVLLGRLHREPDRRHHVPASVGTEVDEEIVERGDHVGSGR